jgi:rhamnosyltransferase subunit B
MAKIVFGIFGSLGDLHPHIALALELKEHGHNIAFATLGYYREKIEMLGFDFSPVRPDINPDDRDLAREFMDADKGTEKLLREFILPVLPESYADLEAATNNADLLITNEVVFAAPILSEKTGLPWISTALAPGGFFSAHDPFVPPNMQWFGKLRFLGAGFHQALRTLVLDKMIHSWGEPIRELRRKLGLRDDVEPIIGDKFSPLLNLALFSKVLGAPQPDWHQPTVQTGFAFYDGKKDTGKMPEGLLEFLQAGEPPIVFTLGSAAVWDARNFFHDSADAAKKLNKRAVLILGENEPPKGLPDNIKAFQYAPYSEVFPLASCVVHQGGVGTTSQVLRAGVPMLVVPFSHDQPDNAARCVRLGVARSVPRDYYNAARAEKELRELFNNSSYKAKALEAKAVIDSENGVKSACDEIEKILRGEDEYKNHD